MVRVKKESAGELSSVPATSADMEWISFQRAEKRETLKRIEETAKYLSGIISISFSVVLNVEHSLFAGPHPGILLNAGIIAWILAIIISLFVLFPLRYAYVENSAASIQDMNKRVSRVKFVLLIAAAVLYITGISIIAYLSIN